MALEILLENNMHNFTEFKGSTVCENDVLELDVLGVIKTYSGSARVKIESDHVSSMIPTMTQVNQIIDALPEEIDYDILVHSMGTDFSDEKVKVVKGSKNSEDFEYEIDEDDIVNEDEMHYELIIYTYNTTEVVPLDEIRRRIKINAKGKRRIKMQCKKGFKFDGKKCVKISGTELVNKRRAIRKAIRTKRSKGSGFQKRVARLRNRAVRKRRGMGVKNFKK